MTFFPSFIGGSDLPGILTAEEEEKYIKLWEKGDVSARNELIEHNLRLVAHIAKKYNQFNDNEDLISIGTIGLVKAVSTYRADKGRLATYGAKCIENAMLKNDCRSKIKTTALRYRTVVQMLVVKGRSSKI